MSQPTKPAGQLTWVALAVALAVVFGGLGYVLGRFKAVGRRDSAGGSSGDPSTFVAEEASSPDGVAGRAGVTQVAPSRDEAGDSTAGQSSTAGGEPTPSEAAPGEFGATSEASWSAGHRVTGDEQIEVDDLAPLPPAPEGMWRPDGRRAAALLRAYRDQLAEPLPSGVDFAFTGIIEYLDSFSTRSQRAEGTYWAPAMLINSVMNLDNTNIERGTPGDTTRAWVHALQALAGPLSPAAQDRLQYAMFDVLVEEERVRMDYWGRDDPPGLEESQEWDDLTLTFLDDLIRAVSHESREHGQAISDLCGDLHIEVP